MNGRRLRILHDLLAVAQAEWWSRRIDMLRGIKTLRSAVEFDAEHADR